MYYFLKKTQHQFNEEREYLHQKSRAAFNYLMKLHIDFTAFRLDISVFNKMFCNSVHQNAAYFVIHCWFTFIVCYVIYEVHVSFIEAKICESWEILRGVMQETLTLTVGSRSSADSKINWWNVEGKSEDILYCQYKNPKKWSSKFDAQNGQ